MCGYDEHVGCKGCCRKGQQPPGTPCDPTGKRKANNAIYNPIHNPINSLRRKLAYCAASEAHLLEEGRIIINEEDREAIAIQLATDRCSWDSRLHDKSLDDLYADGTFCGYLGETKRGLDDKALRWLTQRGSSLTSSGLNRPVLAWAPQKVGADPQNKHITMGQAKKELGFAAVFLWYNEESNTTFIEAELQKPYDHLGLPRRLHRRVGVGSHGFGARHKEDATELHKVFLAYSFDVHAEIDAGNVIVVI